MIPVDYFIHMNPYCVAHKTVKDLEDKLFSLEALDIQENNNGKEIRIWMDGAFDMMHFCHMNAFRQGRALGTTLVVGVNRYA